MGYTKFQRDRHPELEGFLRDLESLEPSGKYWIRGMTDKEQSSLRSYLYAWMHTAGVKEEFKIQSFPGELLIIRRGLGSRITTSVERPPLAPKLEELLSTALGLKDPGQFIQQQREEGLISYEEMGTVLDRLGKLLE